MHLRLNNQLNTLVTDDGEFEEEFILSHSQKRELAQLITDTRVIIHSLTYYEVHHDDLIDWLNKILDR